MRSTVEPLYDLTSSRKLQTLRLASKQPPECNGRGSSTADLDVEFSIMKNNGEEAIDAPLMREETARASYEEDEDRPSHVQSSRQFVWALTFAAGISGLLFGYELSSIVLRWLLALLLIRICQKHRSDLFDACFYWPGPLAPFDHSGQEPDHFLHELLCPHHEPGRGRPG